MKGKRMHRQLAKILVCILIFSVAAGSAGCSGKKKVQLDEVQMDEAQPEDDKSKKESDSDVKDDSAGKNEQKAAKKSENVFVYVCGEVKAPGVYELPAGSRVYQVIEMAQGLTDNADPSSVNQAESAADGAKVYVPAKGESAAASGVSESGTGSASGKVNLNTASKEELMTLTGIGDAKAAAIINYRQEHGKFGSIEELKDIEGIKDGVFNKIKDNITV